MFTSTALGNKGWSKQILLTTSSYSASVSESRILTIPLRKEALAEKFCLTKNVFLVCVLLSSRYQAAHLPWDFGLQTRVEIAEELMKRRTSRSRSRINKIKKNEGKINPLQQSNKVQPKSPHEDREQVPARRQSRNIAGALPKIPSSRRSRHI
jgi:hypothetical protein